MPKRTWEIVLDGQSHLIQLNHGTFTSKHEVYLDGQIVAHSRHIMDVGSQHTFVIDQHHCEVHVVSNGIQYRYLLFVDDQPYLAREDSRRQLDRDKLMQRGVAIYQYWHSLARLLGLRYLPDPKSTDPFRQRLLGEYKGYLTAIHPTAEKERASAGVGVLLRYRSVDDLSAVQSQILAEPAVEHLFGKERTWRYNIGGGAAFCVFPYRPLKVGAEQVASQISEWVELINRYTRPEQLDHCEGDHCPDRNAPVQVVLVNSYPMLLCSHCITKIPGWGEELQQAYQAAPSNLSRGLLATLGVAVFGAIVWAAVAVGFNVIATVISVAVFMGTVRLMDRSGVKRSGSSLMLAAVLTLLSAVLGVYLAQAWDAVNELPQSLSLSSLSSIITTTWQKLGTTRLFGQAIAFCLFGVIPFLLWMWWEQRQHYLRLFRPVAEVVGPKWF